MWSKYSKARDLIQLGAYVPGHDHDLDQAVRVQKDRMDLKSRVDALLLLQDRMEQLDRYKKEGGITTSLGLYQGDAIREKLLREIGGAAIA